MKWYSVADTRTTGTRGGSTARSVDACEALEEELFLAPQRHLAERTDIAHHERIFQLQQFQQQHAPATAEAR